MTNIEDTATPENTNAINPGSTENTQNTVFLTDYQKQLMSQWARNHKSSPPIIAQNGQALWINRKERRKAASYARRAKDTRTKYDFAHAINVALKEQSESPRVQAKLLSGELDKFLDPKFVAVLKQIRETIKQSIPVGNVTE